MKQQGNKKRPENAWKCICESLEIFRGNMPPDPSRVERPSGLWQIYPPVTFKYPLAQKLIETPANYIKL